MVGAGVICMVNKLIKNNYPRYIGYILLEHVNVVNKDMLMLKVLPIYDYNQKDAINVANEVGIKLGPNNIYKIVAGNTLESIIMDYNAHRVGCHLEGVI